MAFAVGIALAFGVAAFAAVVGFDRDRAFYPTVLVVIALYYVLFAVMSGSGQSVLAESAIMAAFAAMAAVGFRTNLWIVAAGLAAHGVLDAFHAQVVTNTGVPAWWPSFCMAFDVAAAGVVAWLVRQRQAPMLASRSAKG